MYKIIKPDDFEKVKLPGLTAWLVALRSGKYGQAKGVLCSSNGKYCCLGVLSKIQGRLIDDGIGNVDKDFIEGLSVSKYGGLSASNPLYNQLNWNGRFPTGCSVEIVCADGEERSYEDIAPCNDEGLNFNQIADILEEFFVDEN